MAQNVQDCLVPITQLLQQNSHQQNVTFRQKVKKDLKYLAPFEGNVKELPSFIEAIDRA